MIFNVAQLLKADVGTTRRYAVDEWVAPWTDQVVMVAPVEGAVEFIRTNRGILVRARMTTSVQLDCSRCLEVCVEHLPIEFAEEYIPTIDVATGLPAKVPHESYAFRIDEKHELDLEPAVREYGLLALPMQPLCRDDCAGLCPQCGANQNQGKCQCVVEAADGRFAVLRALLSNQDESA